MRDRAFVVVHGFGSAIIAAAATATATTTAAAASTVEDGGSGDGKTRTSSLRSSASVTPVSNDLEGPVVASDGPVGISLHLPPEWACAMIETSPATMALRAEPETLPPPWSDDVTPSPVHADLVLSRFLVSRALDAADVPQPANDIVPRGGITLVLAHRPPEAEPPVAASSSSSSSGASSSSKSTRASRGKVSRSLEEALKLEQQRPVDATADSSSFAAWPTPNPAWRTNHLLFVQLPSLMLRAAPSTSSISSSSTASTPTEHANYMWSLEIEVDLKRVYEADSFDDLPFFLEAQQRLPGCIVSISLYRHLDDAQQEQPQQLLLVQQEEQQLPSTEQQQQQHEEEEEQIHIDSEREFEPLSGPLIIAQAENDTMAADDAHDGIATLITVHTGMSPPERAMLTTLPLRIHLIANGLQRRTITTHSTMMRTKRRTRTLWRPPSSTSTLFMLMMMNKAITRRWWSWLLARNRLQSKRR